MKVLVAEDDDASRLLLQRHVQRWGYEFVAARDGQAAWDILKGEDPPCIAVIDWIMPQLDGPEVCRRVRDAQSEPYIYIILLTGRGTREDVVLGLEAGADDYITKPFNAHELEVRLRAGKRIVDLQSELYAARERLRIEASIDPLTGVMNRGAMIKALQAEASRAVRARTPVSVVMADIDYFKKVNDTFGHKAGDDVLVEAAQRMRASLRTYDGMARFGGEEFLLLLPSCTAPDALVVAERLRESLAQTPIRLDAGVYVPVTCSLGVAAWDTLSPLRIESLIERADAALYRAKAQGRNQVVVAPVVAEGFGDAKEAPH